MATHREIVPTGYGPIGDMALRQAVLCGPRALANLRAERERHARLAAAALIRDRRLVKAIRRSTT